MTDDMIETVARAICREREADDTNWRNWREEARAAIQTIGAALAAEMKAALGSLGERPRPVIGGGPLDYQPVGS